MAQQLTLKFCNSLKMTKRQKWKMRKLRMSSHGLMELRMIGVYQKIMIFWWNSYKFNCTNRLDDEKSALLNFAAETYQPLKPIVQISPLAMGASKKLYVPGKKKSFGYYPCIRHVIDGKCPFGNECKNLHDEGRCREYYFQVIKNCKMNRQWSLHSRIDNK